MTPSVRVRTSPSLALTKYWGRAEGGGNIPATTSIALTLDSLNTESTIGFAEEDLVVLDGKPQNPERYSSFFGAARELLGRECRFRCESRNSFPTAAGLASSSSGFAALAVGINALTGETLSPSELSVLAGSGSVSAARAVFGGYTCLPAGRASAEPLFPADHWPELRVIVVAVDPGRKVLSSRSAMALSSETSPFFEEWVRCAEELSEAVQTALRKKDLSSLGPLIRMSYLRMFSTMFSADPPLIYWLPGSLDLIHFCGRMRDQGIGAWETMDAGPQVKIFCLKEDTETLTRALDREFPGYSVVVDRAGPGPAVLERT